MSGETDPVTVGDERGDAEEQAPVSEPVAPPPPPPSLPLDVVMPLLRLRERELVERRVQLERWGLVLTPVLVVPITLFVLYFANHGHLSSEDIVPLLLQGLGTAALLGAAFLAGLLFLPLSGGRWFLSWPRLEERLRRHILLGRPGAHFAELQAGAGSRDDLERLQAFVSETFLPGAGWDPVSDDRVPTLAAELLRLWESWFLVERQAGALRRALRLVAIGLVLAGAGLIAGEGSLGLGGPGGPGTEPPPPGGMQSGGMQSGGTQGGGMQSGGKQSGGTQGGGTQGGGTQGGGTQGGGVQSGGTQGGGMQSGGTQGGGMQSGGTQGGR